LDAVGLEKLVRSVLGDAVEAVEHGHGVVQVKVSVDKVVEAARALKEAGFDHAKDVTAVHDKKEGRIRVIYHLSSYTRRDLSRWVLGLYYEVPEDRDRVPSLYSVYTSVDFQEREVYEGFGLYFEGHPDMRPLLLAPTVAEQKPLRRDFVVKEENIFRQ